MEPRIFLYVLVGAAVACAIGLEERLRRLPFSLPLLYTALGFAAFSLPFDLGWLNPAFNVEQAAVAEYATEFIVIVSLLGVGLSIDRALSWKNWKSAAPLLWLTMPLCIAGVAWMGWSWLSLAPSAALLLGASLAPTDPVLASAVQVGPPGESDRDDVKFNLSAEAGFNDSLAFPFVYLAIVLSQSPPSLELFGTWLGVDVFWRIFAGALVGWGIGKAASWVIVRASKKQDDDEPIFKSQEGLLVMSSLFLAYGLAEIVEGYGFLAVFIGAVITRQDERKHEVHGRSHQFIAQIEKIMLVMMLIFFGGLLASGVLNSLTWWSAILGLVFLLVLRPLAGMLAMIRSGIPWQGRLAVGFLGVRGLGSIYYLSYGQTNGNFSELDLLWSAVAFTILLSIVIHGLTAAPIVTYLSKRQLAKSPGSDDSVMP